MVRLLCIGSANPPGIRRCLMHGLHHLLFCQSSEMIVNLIINPVSRGLHATGVKKMGAHGHDEPFYVHAKHMYNLDRMKHQKLKMSLGVLAAFSIGVAVPVYAVIFQQKKTASG